MSRRRPPSGAMRETTLPDGRVVVEIWNDELGVWTFEHPDDHGEVGLSCGFWVAASTVIIIGAAIWALSG